MREKEQNFKRKAIQQHKDLLTDPRYRHKVEVSKKIRLNILEQMDFEAELKEYINGRED